MNTLTLMMIGAGAAPMLAAAQVPPAQRPQPAQPPQPPPAIVRVAPAVPPLTDRIEHLGQTLIAPAFDLQFLELEHEIRFSPDLQRLQYELEVGPTFHLLKQDLAQLDIDQIRLDADLARQAAEAARLEAEHLRHSFSLEFPPAPPVEPMEPMLPMPPVPPIPPIPPVDAAPWMASFFGGEKPLNGRPRAPWASEDPADSLYRVAREALNRGEYRRAAQLFNEVVKKYPRSEYAVDCQYWEAFARYRTGSTDDLREALRILDEGRVQLAGLRRESNVDVQALRTRIQAALAARGDARAAEQLKREAPSASASCDREEISVRAEALSALGQMDPAAAKAAVRRVLARRDECTVELRRRALYLVGRQGDAEAASIILDVARNDTDRGIRGEALRWLPRVAGENAVPQLEELLKTTTDEQAQRQIVSALGAVDGERGRRAIRTIIERTDASERVRYDAILSLSREREGRVSADDLAYLRALYGKLESTRLREAVLASVSRAGGADGEQFLLAVARNGNESPSLRAAALQRLGRMGGVSVADIAKLYDGADARALREQILSALSQRKEPEAIDKMMEIARKDTDPHIRRYAISLLSRSNNERAKQLFKELIEQ